MATLPAAKSQIDFTQDLLDIWEDLVGIRPSPEDPIYTFADSVTLLRYCDRVLNTIGQRVYLQDFAESPTIQELAGLVNARADPNPEGNYYKHDVLLHQSTSRVFSHGSININSSVQPKPLSPAASAPAASGDYLQSPEVSEAVSRSLCEIGLGLSYAEDVLPIRDYFRHIIGRQRPLSYVHRVCLAVRKSWTRRKSAWPSRRLYRRGQS